ncbi:hypothetical protein V2J09_008271 [Rumex salicifolius]
MEKKTNQIPSLHGIIFTTLLIMPLAWCTPAKNDDVSIGGPVLDPSPAHTIPANGPEVESWFSKTITHNKERKGVEPDLVEAESKTEIIKVRLDGSGKFKTIKEALDSVEAVGNDNRVIVDIGPGVYREKIEIARFRPYITLYGDPKNRPTLVFGATYPKYEVMDTATLNVEGDYFSAVNLNIVNNAKIKGDQVGIALRVMGNYASFYNCKITGNKSTLLDDEGRHFFKDCLIEGTDDLIFGDGRSIYLNSDIHVLPHEPTSNIAAQARKNLDPRAGGFVFVHCRVTGEPKSKALLGRTYMAGSRVIYAYSTMTNIVEPKGWYDDFVTDYEKTALFGEYKNMGPGAVMTQRINQPCTKKLTDKNVQPFLSLDYIDGGVWLLPAPKSVTDSVKYE